jgi:DNA-binding FadR family transcriptional regulator
MAGHHKADLPAHRAVNTAIRKRDAKLAKRAMEDLLLMTRALID